MGSSEINLDRLTAATFTPDKTRTVLETACRIAGLDPSGAELLRHHTNAVYLLTDTPIVVKISRPDLQHGTDVVALVRWLERNSVPTVRVASIEPMDIAGCTVTYWEYLPQSGIVSAADLALPLSLLHSQASMPQLNLPDEHIHDAFDSIASSIDTSTMLSPDDQLFLHQRRNYLLAQEPGITFCLKPGLIHGDAHHRNALWDSNTQSGVLCDWENAAVGQPEWDLVTVEVHCRRFNHPQPEYQDFRWRYGLDVRDWDGYEWLRDLRELRMISTNARKSVRGSANAHEVQRRIDALRSGSQTTWHIL